MAENLGLIGTRTSALVKVPASVTPVVLKADVGLSKVRRGLSIANASTSVLYIGNGFVPSATDYSVAIAAGGYYEAPFQWQGEVQGIWAAANGNALVTTYH